MGHKSIAGEHEELVAGKIVGMICEYFAIEILRTLVVDDSELFAKVEEALATLGGPEKAKHQIQIRAMRVDDALTAALAVAKAPGARPAQWQVMTMRRHVDPDPGDVRRLRSNAQQWMPIH